MIFILVIVAIIALIVLVGATRPGTFRIERKMTMNVLPEKIFPLVNDFHQWQLWSPWEKVDPTMNRTYSGNNDGVGAIYDWNGNKKVGQGRMEIIESTENKRIFILLDFVKPFAAKNTAEFTFHEQGNATVVVWVMEGKQHLMAKIMCLFMDMDKMVGKDFEKGLSNLQGLTVG